MKRIVAIFLSLFILATTVSGCSQASVPASASVSAAVDDKLSVVCTIFPQYDWTRRILGDKADDFELTMLLNSGVDLHSFQPTVDDVIKISSCDLFIYVGGESDAWVTDALKEAKNPDMIVINLLDTLGDGAKIENIVEGMQDDEEHDHGSEEEHAEEHAEEEHAEEHEEEHAEEEHAEEHEAVYDEHVWLSLKNSEVFCSAIADALSSLDAENAEEYKTNLNTYTAEIETLDAKYKQLTESAFDKTLLFCDRFPFRYLVDDYGLDYYAAFPGCSAETEASFDTIMFLADKASELDLNSVVVTESSDKSIAETVISNTGTKDQEIFILNSLQSVKQSDIDSGETYLSIMEANMNTLAGVLD